MTERENAISFYRWALNNYELIPEHNVWARHPASPGFDTTEWKPYSEDEVWDMYKTSQHAS